MNLKFNDSTKILPRHGQEVWYIRNRSGGFGDYYGFDIAEVEYQWQTEDGQAVCYDPNNPEPPEPDIDIETGEEIPYYLRIFFKNQEAREGNTIWWIDCEEVDNQLGDNE